MAICAKRDTDFNNNKQDILPQVYYPIATCPYRLFPGETRPLEKLLAAELPLKLDIQHEYETEEKNPDGTRVKHTIVIPYAELAKFEFGARHSAYNFLVDFVSQRKEELKIEGDPSSWPVLQELLFAVCAVRTFTDEPSR